MRARRPEQGAGILDDGTVHTDVQSSIDSSRGSGASLDPGVASRLGNDLGDLSDVRVHTDDTADKLNNAVSARAFATGSDVYFAQGEYNPGSADGDKLIAHELAHVVGLGHVSEPMELMFGDNSGQVELGPGDREGLARVGSVPCG